VTAPVCLIGSLADYLALVGDSIDDIPGVLGIGAKTACQLLQVFDNIDELFARRAMGTDQGSAL